MRFVTPGVGLGSPHGRLDKREEELNSDWLWVTTLPKMRASTRAVVNMGHDRWTIENQGFNELVNRWHADHVYKHQTTAMLVFFLFALRCLNVFMAFYNRNLKPAARRAASMLYVAQLIAAKLYAPILDGPARTPIWRANLATLLTNASRANLAYAELDISRPSRPVGVGVNML